MIVSEFYSNKSDLKIHLLIIIVADSFVAVVVYIPIRAPSDLLPKTAVDEDDVDSVLNLAVGIMPREDADGPPLDMFHRCRRRQMFSR